MAQKTAVEWLVSKMPNIGEYIPLGVTLEFQAKIEQAKAMKKDQMMQCYEDGYNRVVKLIEDATQKNLNL